jgi:hypothetical protein
MISAEEMKQILDLLRSELSEDALTKVEAAIGSVGVFGMDAGISRKRQNARVAMDAKLVAHNILAGKTMATDATSSAGSQADFAARYPNAGRLAVGTVAHGAPVAKASNPQSAQERIGFASRFPDASRLNQTA